MRNALTSGIVHESVKLPPREDGKAPVTLLIFADEEVARMALDAGEVQAYYVLPEDYITSGGLELFYLGERPAEVVQDDFTDFLRLNLLVKHPALVQTRVTEGPAIVFEAADGSREFDSGNLANTLVPYVAGFFFFFAIMNSGGYMLQAVTDEKENRTIEILATSLRPEALIGGKALGLMSVGLTQLSIWVVTGVIALLIATPFVPSLQGVRVPWSFLGIAALFFVPAYALMAGMMTAIGAAVTDLRQGQQITGLLNMLFTMPFFFVTLVLAKPNSPIIVALTLFPTTAFVTLSLRWTMTVVPLWQLVLSWTLLVTSAVASVWIAARVFRLGMLRYGQHVSVSAIVASFRGENGQRVTNESQKEVV